MFAGISLRYAPPFGVVCAFFINASFYLIIAGGLFAFTNALSSGYSPQLIALTHCFGLGFFALTMFGALLQMLPVLAGIIIKGVKIACALTLFCVNIGITSFLCAFLGFWDLGFGFAMCFLGLGVGGFAFFIIMQMLTIKHFNATTTYMCIALFALLAGLVCAEFLLASYAGLASVSNHFVLVLCHLSFVIFGWIMLLIIGVILQVLPMFYVAPSFDKAFFAKFIPLFYVLLIAFLCFLYFDNADFSNLLPFIFALIAIFTSFYALKTLKNRHRKSFDSTMFLWHFAFYNLAFSAFCFVLSPLSELFISIGGLLLLLGFVCSVIFAMFYKIIPFLAWFHLSFNGILQLPNMRLIIPPRLIKAQIVLFLCAFVLCFATLLLDFLRLNTQILGIVCGICFVGCGILLIIAVFKAYMVYHLGLQVPKMNLTQV